MSIYSEQLEQRMRSDQEAYLESFENIVAAVEGKELLTSFQHDRNVSQSAIDMILKSFHVKSREIPASISDLGEQLAYAFQPNGIMYRTVKLSRGWYRDAVGAMLGIRKEDGKVIALLPSGLFGYRYYDEALREFVKVNRTNSQLFEDEAFVFYKPLPLKEMSRGDFLHYLFGTLSVSDYVAVIFATLATILIGLLPPMITKIVLSKVVENESILMLIAIAIFSICVSVSALFIQMVSNLIGVRLNTKLSIFVQSATMMRVLFLPASFFHKYSAGDLFSRLNSVNHLCSILISTVLFTGLTSVFSFVYVLQIMNFIPALVIPALLVSFMILLLTLLLVVSLGRLNREKQKCEGMESGLTYALISGIQKIKLAGAEKRAFAKFGNAFARTSHLAYNAPWFLRISPVLPMAISLIGMLVIYYTAMEAGVSVASYYAFITAYGIMTGAFIALMEIAPDLADIKPTLERVEPILRAVPEVVEGRKVVTKLTGNVELDNVYFRYQESMPYVLKDLSLKIKAGQYVAIVGKTGCGKSTLIRLLLGLESPEKGAIYYSGEDLSTLDLKSLRRKIGSVMQDGKLFQGNVFSNIVISAPWLTHEDAWEAAELAGIAEDIRRMPMGMNTVISEGSGGVSGGQRQRLMIARAIAPKPKILIFDEATSALDNITQKKVSESLDALDCTRIVVAHRLSTIKHCDRIIVLDQGSIVEEGTYDELIAKNGFFAELVERQQLN